MTTPERLRSYASELFAMATTAREAGDDDYADRLIAEANELLQWANKGEEPPATDRTIQSPRKPPGA